MNDIGVRSLKLRVNKYGQAFGQITFDSLTTERQVPVQDVPAEIRAGLLLWLTTGGDPE